MVLKISEFNFKYKSHINLTIFIIVNYVRVYDINYDLVSDLKKNESVKSNQTREKNK